MKDKNWWIKDKSRKKKQEKSKLKNGRWNDRWMMKDSIESDLIVIQNSFWLI